MVRLEGCQPWHCLRGILAVCVGVGTAGQGRGHGPPGHTSASPSSTLPQWMKNRWRSWIQARGCRCSRRSRSSPRAGSAAVGAAWRGDTPGHPVEIEGGREAAGVLSPHSSTRVPVSPVPAHTCHAHGAGQCPAVPWAAPRARVRPRSRPGARRGLGVPSAVSPVPRLPRCPPLHSPLHKRPRGGHGLLPPRRHRRHPDSI